MASYPPPPPSGPPFGFDPRIQARLARQQAKAQMRAQKAAFRAQRDLFRYQTRQYRRSSILGPLIVVAIGVLVLLIRMGTIPQPAFWDWYARWWPLLILAAGLLLVAEWAIDQMPAHNDAPPIRRSIGGGAIFLLILLALVGASARGARNAHDAFIQHFNLNADDWDQFFGEKHEATQQLDQDFPTGGTLTINNPHGDITVVGKSDDNKIHITINKQVYSNSDSDANARFDQLSPHISPDNQHVVLNLPAIDGASADLDITLPDSAQTFITSNRGDVTLSAMRAPVNITANHGDIQLNSITGAVSLHVNNRSSTVSAHTINGDLAVRGHANDLNITDVTGQVALEGEFYGDAHLEHTGATSFRTSRTQLSLARLNGQIDITPKADLTGSEIAGPLLLHTRSRNITLDHVAGPVDLIDSDGTIDLTAASPLSAISIENKNGAIDLTLPDRAGFTVDATATSGGSIDNDFNLTSSSHGDTESLHGTVANGSTPISLHTTHLDISLHHKSEPTPAPPTAKPSRF